jgi:hypothetical protein
LRRQYRALRPTFGSYAFVLLMKSPSSAWTVPPHNREVGLDGAPLYGIHRPPVRRRGGAVGEQRGGAKKLLLPSVGMLQAEKAAAN